MTPGQKAEARIVELGIADPRDIDIEAIAFDAGIRVEYEQLRGCAATLVGLGNRAIATIRPSGSSGRDRFSIGHELGHWELHRGRSFQCRADNPSENLASNTKLEIEADEYSTHILMPSALFHPAVRSFKWPSIKEIDEVAGFFSTSLLATTVRLAKIDALPVLVTCYTPQGRRWHVAAPHVPKRWWLKDQLDEDSFAYDLLSAGKPCDSPRKQSADAWFENDDAEEFEVLEQCYSPISGQAIVILYLTDSEMFERGYDPAVWKRRK